LEQELEKLLRENGAKTATIEGKAGTASTATHDAIVQQLLAQHAILLDEDEWHRLEHWNFCGPCPKGTFQNQVAHTEEACALHSPCDDDNGWYFLANGTAVQDIQCTSSMAESKTGLTSAAIMGIAVGCGVFLLAVIVVLVFQPCRCKNTTSTSEKNGSKCCGSEEGGGERDRSFNELLQTKTTGFCKGCCSARSSL
jgi:hypothetical protein